MWEHFHYITFHTPLCHLKHAFVLMHVVTVVRDIVTPQCTTPTDINGNGGQTVEHSITFQANHSPYNAIHTVPQAVTGDIVMETHNTRITSPQPPIALVNVGFPHDKVIILLLQLRTTISDNLFCFRIKVM